MEPARRKALLLAGIGTAAAVAGGVAGALFVQSESGAAGLLATAFADLDGNPRRLLQWQGHVLVCNFWATWCAPCREEVPLLVAARQQYAGAGMEVVGIAVDNADKVREFVAKFSVPYPILVAGPEALEIMRDLGNKAGGLPFTVVLDRAGRIVERHLGAYEKAELDRALAPWLG